MAYLGIFTIIFTSCIMGVLGSSDVYPSDLDDEGRFLFGTSSATGTGATAGATTATQITGWESTLIIGIAFFIVFIIWVFLIFGLPSDVATTAYAATAFDPFAANDFASGHHAPTGFASGHHAPAAHHAPTGHHAADTGLHSSYSVLRSLELAARKYL